jgi:hypothetical protein
MNCDDSQMSLKSLILRTLGVGSLKRTNCNWSREKCNFLRMCNPSQEKLIKIYNTLTLTLNLLYTHVKNDLNSSSLLSKASIIEDSASERNVTSVTTTDESIDLEKANLESAEASRM